MPFRPKKKIPLGKRPSWNSEPDYWLRERRRLELIKTIAKDCGNMRELLHTCPGCGFPIWEAYKGETLFRGCHCLTLTLPPGHRLYKFDIEAWADAVHASGYALRMTSPSPDQHPACVRTLTRIHPSLRDDPFSPIKGSIAGTPQTLGFSCSGCAGSVRRGFTQPELTGFEFSFFACACTGLSRFADLGDPTVEQWREIVAEAALLSAGQVKVHIAHIDEAPEAGGPN